MAHSLISTATEERYSQNSRLNYPLGNPSSAPSSSPSSTSNVHSLAVLWAKKYLVSVEGKDESSPLKNSQHLKDVTSVEGRKQTAEKLMQNLTLASAQAWSQTEILLGEELRRHKVNADLVNPLEIAADTRHLFQKTLAGYGQECTPRRLSVIVGKDFGQVRHKYTCVDRRAIGFVSMQFHYTGQKLLTWLSPGEQQLWKPYLKVMHDHMYIPLHAAYEAAGNHPDDSPILAAVQHFLPKITKIATSVCQQVCRLNPNHKTYSGLLSDATVRIATIRDVEMFQIYLCLCVLENDICSVQRELFPLCVMLYPRLGVSWGLVQEMLKIIGWEMYNSLSAEDMVVFLPYLRILTEMFSGEVFDALGK